MTPADLIVWCVLAFVLGYLAGHISKRPDSPTVNIHVETIVDGEVVESGSDDPDDWWKNGGEPPSVVEE